MWKKFKKKINFKNIWRVEKMAKKYRILKMLMKIKNI